MTATAFAAIPGPRPYPLLGWRGNVMQFYSAPIPYMRQLAQMYGSIVQWVHKDPPWLFAFGPDLNRQLLTDPDRFHSFIILTPAPEDSALKRLGSGLLAMNGDQHKQQRRLIMPAFHKRRVESYRDEMVGITQQRLDTWKIGQLIDLLEEIQQLTLAIASKTLFGIDSDPNSSIGGMIRQWLHLASSNGTIAFPVNLPGTPYRQMLRLSEVIEAELLRMIQYKRASPTDQHDVMAMLIHARDDDGTSMTDTDLIGQAAQLFAAGHETSSNTLTWTLFLLSQHPRVLADVQDELAGILHGDAPTIDHLSQLPLLDRVLKESLRLLPPASYGARIAATACDLGPHTLAQGTTVFFSQYITHRLPTLYSAPQQFQPERWEQIDPSPYEYLPFGAGPRMCIGTTFALTEIKIVLAMLLQRYRLTPPPGARIDSQVRITLSPKAMPMWVEAPSQSFSRSKVRGNIHEMVDFVG